MQKVSMSRCFARTHNVLVDLTVPLIWICLMHIVVVLHVCVLLLKRRGARHVGITVLKASVTFFRSHATTNRVDTLRASGLWVGVVIVLVGDQAFLFFVEELFGLGGNTPPPHRELSTEGHCKIN
ncbi:hypothetical protein, unknown function [Leishmania tarentolae]|uniref:Uncharacterized protein n=1 Tax=Leishmania tarentolae TaxID=5689 RepID=A0A640KEX9_LEITA|nr:hypothetical protein, unknown function [Leishmania tarentolae]